MKDLKSRMAALSNEVYDLLRELKAAGGYYVLSHDILQLAEVHVRHASQVAAAAEALEHHKTLVGSKGTVLVRTGKDKAVAFNEWWESQGLRPGAGKSTAEAVWNAALASRDDAGRTPEEEREARTKAGRCLSCGCLSGCYSHCQGEEAANAD